MTVNSTVDRLGPARVRLVVTVPWAALGSVLREACIAGPPGAGSLAGFRTGRLPFHPIDQRVGAAVLPRAVEAALLDLVATAAREHGLDPLGRSDVEIIDCGEGAPLRFAAVLDVRPEVTVPDASSLVIRVDPVSVSEDELQACLDELREQMAAPDDVDGPVTDGDLVRVELRTSVDGTIDETDVDGTQGGVAWCEIGSGRPLVGVDPAVVAVERLSSILDTALVGLVVGGSVTLTAPAVGGVADVVATVAAVRRKRLSTLDQFAARTGFGSTVDELRAAIADRLVRAKDTARLCAARDEALRQLTEAAAVSAPEGLVRDEVEHRRQWMLAELHRLGTSLADQLAATATTAEQLDAELVAATTQRVCSQLLLDALADTERLSVSTDELAEAVKRRGQIQATDVRRGKALALVMQRATFIDPAGDPVVIRDLAEPVTGSNHRGS
jgi:trigger factor